MSFNEAKSAAYLHGASIVDLPFGRGRTPLNRWEVRMEFLEVAKPEISFRTSRRSDGRVGEIVFKYDFIEDIYPVYRS